MKIRHAIRRRRDALIRLWNFHIKGKMPDRPFNGAFVHLPDGGLHWCPPIEKDPGADEVASDHSIARATGEPL